MNKKAYLDKMESWHKHLGDLAQALLAPKKLNRAVDAAFQAGINGAGWIGEHAPRGKRLAEGTASWLVDRWDPTLKFVNRYGGKARRGLRTAGKWMDDNMTKEKIKDLLASNPGRVTLGAVGLGGAGTIGYNTWKKHKDWSQYA